MKKNHILWIAVVSLGLSAGLVIRNAVAEEPVKTAESAPAARHAARKAWQETRRKERFLIERDQRKKRWAFEEKWMLEERKLQDELRKARQEFELHKEDALMADVMADGDPREARLKLRQEQLDLEKTWREKREDFRKRKEADRKAFRAESEAERKAFREKMDADRKGP